MGSESLRMLAPISTWLFILENRNIQLPGLDRMYSGIASLPSRKQCAVLRASRSSWLLKPKLLAIPTA